MAPNKASAKNKANRSARPAARENTKMAKVIALLQQPGGAMLQTIVCVTGWQSELQVIVFFA